MQFVVQSLESQGTNPTSTEIQQVQNGLISSLSAALNQVIAAGVNAIEQAILTQLESTAANRIQPAQNKRVAYAEGVCAEIGLAAAVLGAEPVALFFGPVSFALWAFNESGFFD